MEKINLRQCPSCSSLQLDCRTDEQQAYCIDCGLWHRFQDSKFVQTVRVDSEVSEALALYFHLKNHPQRMNFHSLKVMRNE